MVGGGRGGGALARKAEREQHQEARPRRRSRHPDRMGDPDGGRGDPTRSTS